MGFGWEKVNLLKGNFVSKFYSLMFNFSGFMDFL